MNVLGLDIETTGLNKDTHDVLEVAVVAWNTEKARPLQFFNWLMRTTVPDNIAQITGIDQETVNTFGINCEDVYGGDAMYDLFGISGKNKWDALVAHNGRQFDIPFLVAHIRRSTDWETLAQRIETVPLIDTRYDLPPNANMVSKGRKLEDFALAHNITNPFAHRALTDVLVMLMIAQQYDLQHIVDNVLPSPMVYITYPSNFPGSFWWPEKRLFRRPVRECYFEKEKQLLVEKGFGEAGLVMHAIPEYVK